MPNTSTLYVKKGCPHCTDAKKLIGHLPEKLRSQIDVSEISFTNRPANVTRVPTLITQNGDMHVGSDVFKYLKKWRHDADPPHTEAYHSRITGWFNNISTNQVLSCLFVVALIISAFWFLKRGGASFNFRRGVAPAYDAMEPLGLGHEPYLGANPFGAGY